MAVRIAVCCAWVLAASVGFPGSHAIAQQRTQVARSQPQIAVILADTPLRLLPDSSLSPLLMIQSGVIVRVNRIDGLWAEVVVEKSQFGPRTGYVESRYIQLDSSKGATGSTASNQPTGDNAAAQPAALPLIRERVPDSGTRPPRPARASETFHNSKINVTVEDKTRESDVIIRYDPSALIIVDKKSGEAMKTFRYAEMEGAEKHWFLVQGPGDYALLHLDKSNYRLIVASFEARTGLKVEAVTDTK